MGIGSWNREMSTSARFFFQFLPLGLTPYLHLRFPSMSRFRRFFSSSIISPRFIELLFCRLPVSSICGRPAGLSAAKKPRLFAGSFKKGKPRFREQEAGRSLLNSQALNWSWKCGDFLIGDIRWGLSLLPSELHAAPAVRPVKILYPSVLGSRN